MVDTNKSKGKSRKTGKTAKRKRATPKEKTPTIPRLDQPTRGGMDKMPSNAPTMAIAPSDYEHIFHEGPGGGGNASENTPSRSPQQQQQISPPPPLPPAPAPRAQQAQAQQYNQDYNAQAEVQVTPDGYTMLGQAPLEMNASGGPSRRIALPSHIVRASNQFSRAVLARVAKYLASRAEQNY